MTIGLIPVKSLTWSTIESSQRHHYKKKTVKRENPGFEGYLRVGVRLSLRQIKSEESTLTPFGPLFGDKRTLISQRTLNPTSHDFVLLRILLVLPTSGVSTGSKTEGHCTDRNQK